MSPPRHHHPLRRQLRNTRIRFWRIWRRVMETVRGIVYKKPLYVILIRHGESMRNKLKPPGMRFMTDEQRERHREVMELADPDVPLSDQGHRQAKSTGLWLLRHGYIPHTVYFSPYQRIRETKDDLLLAWSEEERQAIREVHSDLLREKAVGYTFGMTEAEVYAYFPFYPQYVEKFGDYYTPPPGGESQAAVGDRIEVFMQKYFGTEAGNTICIITHGDPYNAFRAKFERWDPLHWPVIEELPKHCGITIYVYDALRDRYRLKEYNLIAWKEEAD